MKHFLLLFLFPFFLLTANGQNWLNSAGGSVSDESHDVEVDASGNIYSTGFVTSSGNFGPGITFTTYGLSDIYVSKSSSSGNFIWAKTFGGSLSDRGYDLTLDSDGNIYVTGSFQGTATFGSVTLVSNGTQEVFVVKLDNSGNVLWAKAEGGPDGDIGYGIAVDNSGNVVVTGHFKGTAQIGNNTFTSVLDPNTNEPSYDIFVVKYDFNGNPIWSIQGAAKYDDRGLALTTDQIGNVYLTGQFSDTLSIAGIVYENNIFNAGMILKLDPAGNHLWFRRLAGIQTLIADIELYANEDILITGDFQGQLWIEDNTGNNFLNGNYQYRMFLMRLDSNGDIIWMTADASDSRISSKAVALDASGTAYVSGTFKCVFDDYADELGSGLFNSVGYDDVFITSFDQTGTRQWMRQYGGPFSDWCSGIAVSTPDNPVISGGYTEYFNFPLNPGFTIFPSVTSVFEPYSWNTPCPVDDYMHLDAVGSKDIFIGKPVDLSLGHYHYYDNVSCFEDYMPCIGGGCPDSLVFCETGSLTYFTYTVENGIHDDLFYTTPNDHHGPYFDFLWNTGSTGSGIGVSVTGDYWATTQRIDGCASYADTVHVQVNPIPSLPLLTDDHGVNLQAAYYQGFDLCFPDTVTTWFTGLDSGLQFTYSTPSGMFTDTLPHQIYEEGYFDVVVVDGNGCSNGNSFYLNFDYPASDTIVPYLLQLKDTICPYEVVPFIVSDSLSIASLDSVFCSYAIVEQNWNIGSDADSCLSALFSPDTTGWYTISVSFILGYNNACGVDTTHYFVSDSFYIVVNTVPEAEITLDGNSPLCPGDTVSIWTDTIISGFGWSASPGNITGYSTQGDSIFVNQVGMYYYGGFLIGTNGCIGYAEEDYLMLTKPPPTILGDPDNIICPGDSQLLICPTPALSYEWTGPGGLLGANDSLWAYFPGFYTCEIVDFDGCRLSNTIILEEYSTPYLIVSPSSELCHTGSAQLTAIYNGAPDIWWQPPISASTASVTVSQPGTYYVEVTQCGITVIDSVVITLTPVSATITALTDTVICLGETAILMALEPTGTYEWNPGGWPAQTLQTQDEGTYTVTVTNDETGCWAISQPITISYHEGSLPPEVDNMEICQGSTATLWNNHQNVTTTWYSAPTGTNGAFTGNPLVLTNVMADTLVFVENNDSHCVSERIPISVSMTPASLQPTIIGNLDICEGSALQLSTPYLQNGNYSWSGPNGFTSSSNSITIPNVDPTDAGTYTLSVSDANCSSPPASVEVTTLPVPQATLDTTGTLWKCASDSLTITASGNFDQISWSSGQQSNSINITLPGVYTATATLDNGCSAVAGSVNVLNYAVLIAQVTDTTLCYGESVQLHTSDSVLVNWYDNDLVLLATDTFYQTPPLYTSTEYNVTQTDANGCEGPFQTIHITIIPANGYPNVIGDTTVCEGQSLVLTTDTISGASYQWSNSTGMLSSSVGLTIDSVTLVDEGVYHLLVSNVSCINSERTFNVSVDTISNPPTIMGDTVYCLNDTLLLYTDSSPVRWNGPNVSDTEQDTLRIAGQGLPVAGLYTAVSLNNGCPSVPDSVDITVLDLPQITTISPQGDFCVGDSILLSTPFIQGRSYLWAGPNSFASIASDNWLMGLGFQHTGFYSVMVVDTFGCSASDSTFIQVYGYPNFDLGNDTVLCVDSLSSFVLYVDPSFSHYLWQDGSTQNYLDVQDTGFFHLTADIMETCFKTDTVHIGVKSCLATDPFNVITPNGDGSNDVFIILNLEYYPNSPLTIYNRWGRIVYETSDYRNDWDGGNLSDGTYYYICDVNDPTGEVGTLKGYITLLRVNE